MQDIPLIKLRQDKILGESTMSKIRKGEIVSAENLAILCELLQCQVGDLIEYRPNSTENGVQNQQEKKLIIWLRCQLTKHRKRCII